MDIIPQAVWKAEIFGHLSIQELFNLEITSKYFRAVVMEIKERRKLDYLLEDVLGNFEISADEILDALKDGQKMFVLQCYPDNSFSEATEIFAIITNIAEEITSVVESCDYKEDSYEGEETKTCELCDNNSYLKERDFLLCREHLLEAMRAHPITAFRVNELFVEGTYRFDWYYNHCDLEEFQKSVRDELIPTQLIYGYSTWGMAGRLYTGLLLGIERSSSDAEDESNEEDESDEQSVEGNETPAKKVKTM